MRVGIDATLAAQARIVGISRFVVNLVEQLAAREELDRYDLFYRPRALRQPRRFWQPRDPRFRSHLLCFPLTLASFRGLDVYHGTYQWLPRYCGGARIVGMLHDIVYMSRPDLGSQRTRERAQARYRDVAARSHLIATLSAYSKAEIVRLLGVEPARVRIVPLAAEPHYQPQSDERVAAARHRHALEQPYVLFGGGFARRKNATGALRSFARALPRLPPDVRLAISGAGGPLAGEAAQILRQPALAGRVQVLGYVSEDDYPSLMSGSLLFFLPTLLEGFGLPVLEAMACGAPVLSSSTTSVPEVCGDAAVLVDPEDETALADALVDLCRDGDRRRSLRQLGLERARQFSWQRVAETMLDIYQQAGSRGRPRQARS